MTNENQLMSMFVGLLRWCDALEARLTPENSRNHHRIRQVGLTESAAQTSVDATSMLERKLLVTLENEHFVVHGGIHVIIGTT